MRKKQSLIETIKLMGDNKIVSITTIIVAIIGCSATIIAAVVTGLFGYLGAKTQVEKPLSLTQTAESILISSLVSTEVFPSENNESFVPTETPYALVNPTNTPITQAEKTSSTAIIPLPTETSMVAINEFDWSNIITYVLETPCTYYLLPATLDIGDDEVSWIQDNFPYLLEHHMSYLYSTNPGDSGTFPLFLNITNITNEQFWVSIDNDISVLVHYIQDVPQDVSVYKQAGCGGGGFIRNFSVVPLQSGFVEYNALSSSTDADYYTLEPGETEIFLLSFKCQAPGIYGLRLNIPTSYKDNDGNLVINDIRGIVCPENVSAYEVDGYDESWTVFNSAIYYWNGSEYIKK